MSQNHSKSPYASSQRPGQGGNEPRRNDDRTIERGTPGQQQQPRRGGEERKEQRR